MDGIKFNIAFRRPKYPVIVVSADCLYSAFNIDQLARSCISSIPIDNKSYIQVIDSTGEEFWYSTEKFILSPGFAFKKWTKKRIVEIFNSSPTFKSSLQEYPIKSLSSKRLDRIIRDICEILRA